MKEEKEKEYAEKIHNARIKRNKAINELQSALKATLSETPEEKRKANY